MSSALNLPGCEARVFPFCVSGLQSDRFCGRRSLRRALAAHLASSHRVALWGPAGYGKSALLNHVILNDFAHQVGQIAVVSLANTEAPQDWRTVFEALRVLGASDGEPTTSAGSVDLNTIFNRLNPGWWLVFDGLNATQRDLVSRIDQHSQSLTDNTCIVLSSMRPEQDNQNQWSNHSFFVGPLPHRDLATIGEKLTTAESTRAVLQACTLAGGSPRFLAWILDDQPEQVEQALHEWRLSIGDESFQYLKHLAQLRFSIHETVIHNLVGPVTDAITTNLVNHGYVRRIGEQLRATSAGRFLVHRDEAQVASTLDLSPLSKYPREPGIAGELARRALHTTGAEAALEHLEPWLDYRDSRFWTEVSENIQPEDFSELHEISVAVAVHTGHLSGDHGFPKISSGATASSNWARLLVARGQSIEASDYLVSDASSALVGALPERWLLLLFRSLLDQNRAAELLDATTLCTDVTPDDSCALLRDFSRFVGVSQNFDVSQTIHRTAATPSLTAVHRLIALSLSGSTDPTTFSNLRSGLESSLRNIDPRLAAECRLVYALILGLFGYPNEALAELEDSTLKAPGGLVTIDRHWATSLRTWFLGCAGRLSVLDEEADADLSRHFPHTSRHHANRLVAPWAELADREVSLAAGRLANGLSSALRFEPETGVSCLWRSESMLQRSRLAMTLGLNLDLAAEADKEDTSQGAINLLGRQRISLSRIAWHLNGKPAPAQDTDRFSIRADLRATFWLAYEQGLDALLDGRHLDAAMFAEVAEQVSSELPALRIEALILRADIAVICHNEAHLAMVVKTIESMANELPSERMIWWFEFLAMLLQPERHDWELLRWFEHLVSVCPRLARRISALNGAKVDLDSVDQLVVDAVGNVRHWRDGQDELNHASNQVGAVQPGGWEVNSQEAWVRCPDGRVEQFDRGSRTWALLQALVACGGAASKETLSLHLWPEEEYHPLRHDNRIRVLVRKIRKQVEPNAELPALLQTMTQGYRIGAEVVF